MAAWQLIFDLIVRFRMDVRSDEPTLLLANESLRATSLPLMSPMAWLSVQLLSTELENWTYTESLARAQSLEQLGGVAHVTSLLVQAENARMREILMRQAICSN